jgi:SAM-dependent methyltransferase
MNVNKAIPWPIKIAAKIVISRIPSNYRLWQRLGIFKHGFMEQPAYAYQVFKKHYDRVSFTRQGKGFVSLELGPGDSLFSALIQRANGGAYTYLVDVGPFAIDDISQYQHMRSFLVEKGYAVPDITEMSSLDQLLNICDASYLTKGLASLREIPDKTVDFIWSQAVLEHIRLHDFAAILNELRRVIRPDGVCSHRIDLTDHLGGGLNNLRFSRRIWESEFMANSGFYTNRIRYLEMLELFSQAGFTVDVVGVDRRTELPIIRDNLAAEFRDLHDEDLLVSGFDVILRPL